MRAIFEDLPVGGQQSINAFRYADTSFTTPWHFHPQHELTLIEESSGTKFIGDYVGAYAPGELVLLRGNLPHCWKNHQRTGRSRSTVIQWSPKIFPKVPELAAVSELLRDAARGVLFAPDEVSSLRTEVQQLPEMSAPEKYLRLLSVLHRLSDCRRVLLSSSAFRESLPHADGNRMQRIHHYVEQNYRRRIRLAEVAGQVHLSEQAFNRFFRKTMGRTFFTFLNEYRINRACQLLVETDWPVGQVAHTCGFPSLPFFHRQFKQITKSTPLQYRTKH